MNKYIIDYENAHWCGGQLHVVVSAMDEVDALTKAEYWMEETQRELFADEYFEDGDYNDESAVVINSVNILDASNEHWEDYCNPSQSSFYPEI
jgi:hypothetical protein